MKKGWKFVKHHILSCILLGFCIYIMFYSLPLGLICLIVPAGMMLLESFFNYIMRGIDQWRDNLNR